MRAAGASSDSTGGFSGSGGGTATTIGLSLGAGWDVCSRGVSGALREAPPPHERVIPNAITSESRRRIVSSREHFESGRQDGLCATLRASANLGRRPAMIRYFARLNPERAANLLHRAEVLQVDDQGAQLGFAFSALSKRGFFRDPSESVLAPGALPLLTWPFLDFSGAPGAQRQRALELGARQLDALVRRALRQGAVVRDRPRLSRCASLRACAAANVKLELVARAALESADIEYGGEDWVLVDFAGKRTSFLRRFFEKVRRAEGPSAVVLDNADWYRRGAATLREAGYFEIPSTASSRGSSGSLARVCSSIASASLRRKSRSSSPLRSRAPWITNGIYREALGPELEEHSHEHVGHSEGPLPGAARQHS